MEFITLGRYIPIHKLWCLVSVICITSCASLHDTHQYKMHYSGHFSYDEAGEKTAHPDAGIIVIDENELHVEPDDVFYIRKIECYQNKCVWEDDNFLFILYLSILPL